MTSVTARGAAALAALAGVTIAATVASGGGPFPPWVAEGEVPPPAWARSVTARPGEHGHPGDLVLFGGPSRASGRRGVTAEGTSLPFFGQKRGAGCYASWWLVGPLAWVCADDADLSPAVAVAPDRPAGLDGLLARYEFVRAETAGAYGSLESAEAGEASEELENGWSVAVVEERAAPGGRWARTTKGLWIASADLAPARPSTFRGEALAEGPLDIGWIVADHAPVWAAPSIKEKAKDSRPRFQVVHVREESGPMLRVDDHAWVLSRDVARPRLSPPPADVRAGERWVDVELASQTLLAYQGTRPVYATLVSSGRGAADAATATRTGVHRIWVKLVASDMTNVERDDGAAHYSMQDVPYVQFFDDAIALHGTYWHGDFGHARSHGCVNLAPLDARWLFDFTEPRVPSGWVAAYPTPVDEGTLVRVR